jgi:hypothetical protein
MVTFNNAGRLGNWMFEAAVCISYAKQHNLEFSFPIKNHHPAHCPVYMTEYFNPKFNSSLPEVNLWETQHNYQPLEFKEEWRDNYNIIIQGYRQTKKYWSHCEDYIKQFFHPGWELYDDVVGVHVRRGDYLLLVEKHPKITKEYYEETMSKFEGKKFLFCSDDIHWCKVNFGNRNDCYFSEGQSEMYDLMLLANCHSQINSSSTFSWWGAYLGRNEDKVVYTPRLWFTENWMGLNISDIVPETWIKL